MIPDIWRFIVAVVQHWQGLLTGGVITAAVLMYVVGSGHDLPRWIYLALFVGIYFPMSCFLAWRDEHHRARQMDDRRRQQEQAAAVARRRAEGVQLYAREVTSGAEMERWAEEYNAWWETARQSLAPFPEPTRLAFENLGPFQAGIVVGSFDDQHNRLRLMLRRQLEILQDIADGR